MSATNIVAKHLYFYFSASLKLADLKQTKPRIKTHPLRKCPIRSTAADQGAGLVDEAVSHYHGFNFVTHGERTRATWAPKYSDRVPLMDIP
jgi:hypothetical protein